MKDIDRQVAEARGWILTTRKIWSNDTKGYTPTDCYIKSQDARRFIQQSNYHPKTNIAQAMELLEEFEEWEIQKDGLYYVVIDATKNGDYSCNGGWQPTLNRAICRAFLKAKGKEAQDVRS